jgi:hypothetical protein
LSIPEFIKDTLLFLQHMLEHGEIPIIQRLTQLINMVTDLTVLVPSLVVPMVSVLLQEQDGLHVVD